jgi:phosphopantetheinyl transferase (holo-ACP synthase)
VSSRSNNTAGDQPASEWRDVRKAMPEHIHWRCGGAGICNGAVAGGELAQLLGAPGPIALTNVAIPAVAGALASEGGEAFLGQWMSAAEQKQYGLLKAETRRLEWLAGRIAAKEAVRILQGPVAAPRNAVTVRARKDGSPLVLLRPGTALEPPQVSIAHSLDVAVAAATAGVRPGIDVQSIEPGVFEIRDAFTNDAEVSAIAACGDLSAAVILNLVWALKEAARKAVGAAKCPMEGMNLRGAEASGAYIACRMESSGGGPLRAVALATPGYVYALALPA